MKPMPEVLPRQTLLDMGKLIEEADYRSFYYFLALTGARITEGLKVKRDDFRIATSRKTGNPAWVVTLITEKRADQLPRTIPLKVFNDEPDEVMAELVLSSPRHWEHLDRSIAWRKFRKYLPLDKVEAILGRHLMETNQGREAQAESFRMFPHYLRHCRATHLSHVYKPIMLQKYFGWKSLSMVSTYTNYLWEDLEL